MLTSLESGLGLDIVVGLQNMRSPLLDTLASVLHFMGGDLFYLLILPLLYWSVSRSMGRRMLFTIVVILVAVVALKLLVRSPRPYEAFPDQVVATVDQPGYGIPSGHVAMALVMWGYLIVAWFKHPRLWWILAAFLAIMAWSRMYAGVHYPQDEIAGLLLGGIVLWLLVRGMDTVARWWHAVTPAMRIAALVLATIVLTVMLYEDNDGLTAVGIMLGGGLGALWEERQIRFSAAGSRQSRALRYGIGLALLLILFFGLRAVLGDAQPEGIFRVLRYSIVAFFGLGIWPWLCVRVGLAAHTAPTTTAAGA